MTRVLFSALLGSLALFLVLFLPGAAALAGDGIPTRPVDPLIDDVVERAAGDHGFVPVRLVDRMVTLPQRMEGRIGVSEQARQVLATDGGAAAAPAPHADTAAPHAASGPGHTLVASLAFLGGLFFVGVPLFARIRRERLLEHPLRALLVSLVEGEPGITIKDLVSRAETPRGTVVHHLGVLERAGRLTSRTEHNMRRWFPDAKSAERHEGPSLHPTAAALLERIRERPGCAQQELVALVGVSRATVWYQTTRLAESGLVQVVRDPKGTRYLPAADP